MVSTIIFPQRGRFSSSPSSPSFSSQCPQRFPSPIPSSLPNTLSLPPSRPPPPRTAGFSPALSFTLAHPHPRHTVTLNFGDTHTKPPEEFTFSFGISTEAWLYERSAAAATGDRTAKNFSYPGRGRGCQYRCSPQFCAFSEPFPLCGHNAGASERGRSLRGGNARRGGGGVSAPTGQSSGAWEWSPEKKELISKVQPREVQELMIPQASPLTHNLSK